MNLSEKELLLLEAYRVASPTEKQRLDPFLLEGKFENRKKGVR